MATSCAVSTRCPSAAPARLALAEERLHAFAALVAGADVGDAAGGVGAQRLGDRLARHVLHKRLAGPRGQGPVLQQLAREGIVTREPKNGTRATGSILVPIDELNTLDQFTSNPSNRVEIRALRTHIGLDYFDASINRVAAWVIGTRNMLKALLKATLEPSAMLRERESAAAYTDRLALQEEFKALPWGAVWDYYCTSAGLPKRASWLAEIKQYESDVLSARA